MWLKVWLSGFGAVYPAQVYVVSAQKQLMEERMGLVNLLWEADIRWVERHWLGQPWRAF